MEADIAKFMSDNSNPPFKIPLVAQELVAPLFENQSTIASSTKSGSFDMT